MGCTSEEQATYDAFFGDAPNVVSTITVDVSQMINVGGRGAGKAQAAKGWKDAMQATEQRHIEYNEDIERRIWQPVPDKPMTGIISQMVAAHESHEPYEALKVKEGMYKEVAKGYKPMQWDNVSVMLNGVEIANMNKGNKPIELEDIMHIRDSVPHFMGHPVPSWEDVDRIEAECKNLSNNLNIQFHAACSIAAGMFAKAVPDQYSPNKIKVVLKELANQAQFAKEKTIFNCRISARQARRSAQGVKFAKQLKNNFNVKKGK